MKKYMTLGGLLLSGGAAVFQYLESQKTEFEAKNDNDNLKRKIDSLQRELKGYRKEQRQDTEDIIIEVKKPLQKSSVSSTKIPKIKQV